MLKVPYYENLSDITYITGMADMNYITGVADMKYTTDNMKTYNSNRQQGQHATIASKYLL